MALRVKKIRTKVCVAGKFHPDYKVVLETYLHNINVEVVYQEIDSVQIDSSFACIITQLPDYAGNINNLQNIREVCNQNDAMMIVVNNEILAFGMIEPPKFADIICGDASSLGVPLSFGGPLLGYFTCKAEFVRQMPGRVCGVTKDENGKRSFVLTLSAREQHIRRDKATSNICSNQGLCATAFTIHATLLGEEGFKNLALQNHQIACTFEEELLKAGFKIKNLTFFNEFVFECANAKEKLQKFEENGILGGVLYSENEILVCVTEMVSIEAIAKYIEILKK
jgi:glycine dehydrogenase subunit 1